MVTLNLSKHWFTIVLIFIDNGECVMMRTATLLQNRQVVKRQLWFRQFIDGITRGLALAASDTFGAVKKNAITIGISRKMMVSSGTSSSCGQRGPGACQNTDECSPFHGDAAPIALRGYSFLA
jgi:hypothetical protein